MTSYSQPAWVVSSNVTRSGPLKLWTNRIIDAASVGTIVCKTIFPSISRTTTTVIAWCTYILVALHRTLLCEFNAGTLNGCPDSSLLTAAHNRGVLLIA